MPEKNIATLREKTGTYYPKEEIYIRGARANNLKDISLSIPKNKLIVVTGVSGSGKPVLSLSEYV